MIDCVETNKQEVATNKALFFSLKVKQICPFVVKLTNYQTTDVD